MCMVAGCLQRRELAGERRFWRAASRSRGAAQRRFPLRVCDDAGSRSACATTPGPAPRLRRTPFVPSAQVFATNAVAPSDMCVASVFSEMCVYDKHILKNN